MLPMFGLYTLPSPHQGEGDTKGKVSVKMTPLRADLPDRITLPLLYQRYLNLEIKLYAAIG